MGHQDAEVEEGTDLELPAPVQHVMAPEEEHGAMTVYVTAVSHPTVAVLGESAFTKAICLDCSIVAPMQPVILGNMCQCFCAEGLAEAGVHGKGGCFKMVSSCEVFQPELRCGIFAKLLCLKVGIVNPLEKPCCVCLNNTCVRHSFQSMSSLPPQVALMLDTPMAHCTCFASVGVVHYRRDVVCVPSGGQCLSRVLFCMIEAVWGPGCTRTRRVVARP